MFHVSSKRLCILLLDEAVYRCQLNPVDWWYFWVQLYPYQVFCLVNLCISDRWDVEIYDSGFNYFSLQSCYLLPHIAWCSVVRCYTLRTDMYSWRIGLYSYVLPFFIPNNSLCFEFSSVWNNIATQTFFIIDSMIYSSPSIYFGSIWFFIFKVLN